MKFPDLFLIPWQIYEIPWLFPDLEEKSNFPDFSLTSGHPEEAHMVKWMT